MSAPATIRQSLAAIRHADQRLLVTAMMRLLLVLLALTLTACAPDTSDALAAAAAVDRAQHFLDVAKATLALGPEFWGRAVGDVYYVGLQVARTKNRSLLLKGAEGFHKKVWGVTSVVHRKFFAETLRGRRAEADYLLIGDSVARGQAAMQELVENGPGNFASLFNEARSSMDDRFSWCAQKKEGCMVCGHLAEVGCLKMRTLTDLSTLESSLSDLLRSELPALLRPTRES